MQKTLWSLFAFLACGSAALFSMSPANAASVRAQGPCAYTNGVCATFDVDDPIPTISTFSFNMPSAGTAVVMFDGTMQCASLSSVVNSDVVDLAGQIVTNPNAVANYTLPGGNRYAMRQLYKSGNSGPSTTVNLASTRTIRYNVSGSKIVFFKLSRLRMDNGTVCSVFAASFTVIITP